MIEQILKHFISDDAKMVISAMEKIAVVTDIEYQLENAENVMYNDAVESGNRVEALVLRLARMRIQAKRRKDRQKANARTLAARILMGEDFVERPKTSTVTVGQQSAMGSQYAQMQGGLSGLYGALYPGQNALQGLQGQKN